MTIMYCQKCHEVAECQVESSQPAKRTLYFEDPYMNAYVRMRTCRKCGGQFRTYEVGEASFKALRKAVEMSNALGAFINSTWSSTRDEFNRKRKSRKTKEHAQFEKDMVREPSYLGENVASIFRKNGRDE